jgi:ribosomal protein S18 acetylase RimI-like enzyme
VRVRSLGFDTDLMVLRLSGSQVSDRGDHVVVRTQSNPSYWWGNFVLVAGPGEVDSGLRIFTEEFPGAGHVALGVDGTDGAAVATDALGLTADTPAVLTAPSDALPAQARVNAELRVLSNGADWEELFRLRMAGAVADGPPAAADPTFQAARVAEARGLSERGAGLFLGAFGSGRLVATLGIVSDGSGFARYQSVLTDVSYRRRGLAGRLLVEAAARARERWAATRLVIVADPEGPAINRYRSLGFAETERQVGLVRGGERRD